jgi:hypothetical protein
VRSLPVRPRIAHGEGLVESVITWFATGDLPVAEAAWSGVSERRRPGMARSPRAAAAQSYVVDDLDFDPREEAVLDRASCWQGRTFTRDDGSTITIERLLPASLTGDVAGGEARDTKTRETQTPETQTCDTKTRDTKTRDTKSCNTP